LGFRECLDNFVVDVRVGCGPELGFRSVYIPETSELIFECDPKYTFEFKKVENNGEGLENWFKFLNVPISKMDNYVTKPTSMMKFQNVWNMKQLYVHSSIANTAPYNYLGHEDEFYQTPTKLYKWTSHSNTIRIWFSLNPKKTFHLYWQPVHISFQ
jgi:hypothetical protein